MRGKALMACLSWLIVGITPAYAGKSLQGRKHMDSQPDHPRVCGEKRPNVRMVGIDAGSPPRMRGKGG